MFAQLTALIFATAAALSADAPRSVTLIPLHPGLNAVSAFTADGHGATIVQAWRDNGNAHGYNTYMVLTPDRSGRPTQLVNIQGPQHPDDVIRDEPFDGERTVGVVRFARANLGGRRQTVLVTASLNWAAQGVFADHDIATIKVYRLVHEETIGATPDRFELAWQTETSKRYCNVDLALRDVLSVPLPAGFQGANRIDGCF